MIGTDAGGLVHRMRVAALEQDVGFGADHEEGRAESEDVEALEIDVAAIHDVERAGLRQNLVEHVDVVHFAVCNADKRWDIATQVQQRMHFDGGLVPPEASPRKQRKAQVDGGGVQRVQACIQVDADRIVGIQRPGNGDQVLCEIGEDAPVVGLVGVRQCRARNPATESHVVEFAAHRLQARLNVAEALAVSELSESHRQILIPTG